MLQAVKSWQSVAMFFRAHGALFGYRPDRTGRRILYALFGGLTILSFVGFTMGYPMLSDRLTPLLWMMAAASCLIGVWHVDSPGVWTASGTLVLAASLWRTLSLLWFEFTDSYPHEQASSSLIAIAVAGWAMATVGSIAVWGAWLRPDQ